MIGGRGHYGPIRKKYSYLQEYDFIGDIGSLRLEQHIEVLSNPLRLNRLNNQVIDLSFYIDVCLRGLRGQSVRTSHFDRVFTGCCVRVMEVVAQIPGDVDIV